jgi:hypothetical protein
LSAQHHQNIEFHWLSGALDSVKKLTTPRASNTTAQAAQGNTAQEAMTRLRHNHAQNTRREDKIRNQSSMRRKMTILSNS